MKRMIPAIDQWGRGMAETIRLGSGLKIPMILFEDLPEGVVMVQGKIDFELLSEKWLFQQMMKRLCGPCPDERR